MLTSLMKVLLGVWLTFSTLTRGYSAADSAQILAGSVQTAPVM